MIEGPYLLFLGDAPDALAAKVAQGIRDWRPDAAIGQFRMAGCNADMGLPDMGLAEAVAAGARTLVVGVANRGGVIAPAWTQVFDDALRAGLDLAAGLHNLLRDEPALVATAATTGRTLHDVRVPDRPYPIGEGRRRTGRRLLGVGTDCSAGKMYTALAMERVMVARGLKASFRATGQTGILITGSGVPLDAVVADFMAGSIEWLTPDNDPDHWDLIEGQGSLFHPSYSGVSLALVHGGCPDALVLCHEPTRRHMRGLPHHKLPTLEDLRDLSLTLARRVNPDVQVTGIAINTAAMHEEAAFEHLAAVEARMGLPAVDPFRQGADRLVDALPVKLEVVHEVFPLARTFTISRGARTEARVITVSIHDDGATGRGECVPYARYGETPASVAAQIAGLPNGFDRAELQGLLPPGAARNAVDCALWDLEARLAGRPVWALAGLAPPGPVITAFTLSLDTPEAMRADAAENAHRPLLKIKLGGAGDLARLEAVREGAPDTRIIVDANEGWTADSYAALAPALAALGVVLVEQPLPAGDDAALAGLPRPVPLCADESCHDRASLPALAARYDLVNIKLDKTGGLTEALALRSTAEALGFGIMVGCMVGSSLAMAPAVLLAQGAAITDLDGPLLLARDRPHPLTYDAAGVHPPAPDLWGGP